MKIDVTALMYIVISLVILLITGLLKKKRKVMPPRPGIKGNMKNEQGIFGNEISDVAAEIISDPFDRLEKILTQPDLSSGMGNKSLEVLVDEEAEYLKEKEKEIPLETIPKSDEYIPGDLTKQLSVVHKPGEEEPGKEFDIFKDVEELKRAVIYSEILKRRDY